MTNQASGDELEKNILSVIEAHFKPNDNSLMPLNATKRVMQLITADRKRVALGARLEELHYIRQKGQRIVVPGMEDRPVWSDAFRERIAELKAQQEEL